MQSSWIFLLVSAPHSTSLGSRLPTWGSLCRASSLSQAQTSATCLHCSPISHFPVCPPYSCELPKTHTWPRPCRLSAFNLGKAHSLFRIKFRLLTLAPEPHPQAPVCLRPCHLSRLDLPLLLPRIWFSGPSDDLPSLGHASGQRTFAGTSLCVWRADIFLFSSDFTSEVIPPRRLHQCPLSPGVTPFPLCIQWRHLLCTPHCTAVTRLLCALQTRPAASVWPHLVCARPCGQVLCGQQYASDRAGAQEYSIAEKAR